MMLLANANDAMVLVLRVVGWDEAQRNPGGSAMNEAPLSRGFFLAAVVAVRTRAG